MACINTSKGQSPILLLPATLAQKDMSYLALHEPVEAAQEDALKQSTFLLRAQGTRHPLWHSPLPCFQHLHSVNSSGKSDVPSLGTGGFPGSGHQSARASPVLQGETAQPSQTEPALPLPNWVTAPRGATAWNSPVFICSLPSCITQVCNSRINGRGVPGESSVGSKASPNSRLNWARQDLLNTYAISSWLQTFLLESEDAVG